MTHRYLPEGRQRSAPDGLSVPCTAEDLTRAATNGRILEGVVQSCTPDHDLIVQLGPFTGVIPRIEVAPGIAQGTTREIAILSRVGRPVCVTVTGLDTDPEGTLRPVLSRRLAQEQVLDHYLSRLRPGDILPAVVTHLEPFGAFVDIGCGLVSMIPIEAISVSRIPHPAARFQTGQEIRVAVAGLDRERRRVLLTHRELLGTWEENARRFAPGMTVPGVIRGVQSYGLFVELAPNLSGLAEYRSDLAEGERVSVYIKSILPQRMKVKLLIIDRLPADPRPEPLPYARTEGHLSRWQYAPEGCLRSGAVTRFDTE